MDFIVLLMRGYCDYVIISQHIKRQKMKKIIYGISNYKMAREKDYLYIDKTKYNLILFYEVKLV
jgi:hypothetical protein